AKLGGYTQTAENQMQNAEDLDAPGPMVVPNAGAVESLRRRVNGLQGLQSAFKEAADETDASVAGEMLLAQTRRLLASDIIWTDSFPGAAAGGAGGNSSAQTGARCRRRSCSRTRASKASTSGRPSSSRPTISSARAP